MIHRLVERVYAALADGDRDELLAVFAPDFHAQASAGMPLGLDGRVDGADDGRLLVDGTRRCASSSRQSSRR